MNLYVGNLALNVSEAELQQAFEAFGEVASVKIIKDKFSGESKGFGFVGFASACPPPRKDPLKTGGIWFITEIM